MNQIVLIILLNYIDKNTLNEFNDSLYDCIDSTDPVL